jgi:hypothetical protein
VRQALAALALLGLVAPAAARDQIPSRNFVETLYAPSSGELKAARRWAGDKFDRAEAAGRPVTVRVARSEGTTMISLESVAICDRVKACPLLVFRDITRPPILETGAFQNLVLDYRQDGTYLILRVWESVQECRISGVTKARCHPLAPGRPAP